MCMYGCSVYTYVCVPYGGQKKNIIVPRIRVIGSWEPLYMGVEEKLGSYVRIARALNC